MLPERADGSAGREHLAGEELARLQAGVEQRRLRRGRGHAATHRPDLETRHHPLQQVRGARRTDITYITPYNKYVVLVELISHTSPPTTSTWCS